MKASKELLWSESAKNLDPCVITCDLEQSSETFKTWESDKKTLLRYFKIYTVQHRFNVTRFNDYLNLTINSYSPDSSLYISMFYDSCFNETFPQFDNSCEFQIFQSHFQLIFFSLILSTDQSKNQISFLQNYIIIVCLAGMCNGRIHAYMQCFWNKRVMLERFKLKKKAIMNKIFLSEL